MVLVQSQKRVVTLIDVDGQSGEFFRHRDAKNAKFILGFLSPPGTLPVRFQGLFFNNTQAGDCPEIMNRETQIVNPLGLVMMLARKH